MNKKSLLLTVLPPRPRPTLRLWELFWKALHSNKAWVSGANLSDAAPSAQGAAGLAEVVVVPAWQRGAGAADAVQVVQAAVVGELSEGRKTAGKEK